MRIILETLLAGPDGIRHPGEHDVGEELAAGLIEAGHATPVETPVVKQKAAVTPPKANSRPKAETASVKPGETATA